MRVPVFVGTHTFAFEKVGFTAIQRTSEISKTSKSVHAELKAVKSKTKAMSSKIAPPKKQSRLSGWVTTGLGTIALATAGTFLSIGLDKRDEAQSINGQFGRQSELMDSLMRVVQRSWSLASQPALA